MFDLNDQNQFSDVPALGDQEGLNAYLEQEALKANGITPQAPATSEPATTVDANGVVQTPATPAAPVTSTTSEAITKEQYDTLVAQVNAINQKLTAPQQAVQQPAVNAGNYTANELAFAREALAKGYNLNDINNVILQRRNQSLGNTAQLNQRLGNIEKFLQDQQYQQAESAFIGKLSTFGDKWGLSEKDLVTFGESALQKGINIAMPNVDLETVFRAIYPEQYAIRAQRMTPTNTSQIYGGTSIPESNRTQASRLEDAYVNDFLSKAMPNYGNKK